MACPPLRNLNAMKGDNQLIFEMTKACRNNFLCRFFALLIQLIPANLFIGSSLRRNPFIICAGV